MTMMFTHNHHGNTMLLFEVERMGRLLSVMDDIYHSTKLGSPEIYAVNFIHRHDWHFTVIITFCETQITCKACFSYLIAKVAK